MMTPAKATDASRMNCDLLVVGSGASGLAAAVTAAWHALKVIVVEKDPVFGGATAWSGGWMWVPGNPLAKRAGINEDGAARTVRSASGVTSHAIAAGDCHVKQCHTGTAGHLKDAREICRNLTIDIDSGEIDVDQQGLDELLSAVKDLQARLARLLNR